MFGKRTADGDQKPAAAAPPAPKPGPSAQSATDRIAGAHASQKTAATGGPKVTAAFEQMRAAQASQSGDVVREQSDYYHATKTTIFNALINTIDLAQLAQL